ncbi:MAG: ATP-binding cassette domain-containing protein [Gammaproteobacteria bacterium]|nr:ATP-binding cassette domain-containing protein [Gammaproteobacteria bacterium]
MLLIRLDKASLAFGHRPLLDHVDLEVRRGERVCLLGRNGEGKSSLLGAITGRVHLDEGTVFVRPGARVAWLDQEVAFDGEDAVFDVVAGGLPEQGRLLADYHHAAAALSHDPSAANMQRLEDLQHRLEAADAWQLEQRVEAVLSRLGLDGDTPMGDLSGGWRRRAMLARALACDPEVLLLDEPTNHLDIEAITWLEEFMTEYAGALLFISHDRAFVRRLATRIVELDRGTLSSWPGSYDDYLRHKSEQLEVEARQNARFDKRLSEEEAWIRQGIKARRTRNEGRVRALEAMRDERRRRRERSGTAKLRLEAGEGSGKMVAEAEDVSFAYGDGDPVIRGLTTTVLRSDRIGIIGPNGAGKSTLLKLLLGDLEPTDGTIKRGTRLQVAYFDQQRAVLDPEVSVMDSVGDGRETVTINGRDKHVAGYLRDFLFPPERLRSPVSTLSGGERNRLLLARLFAQPANLLVMDEPTNDLDVETLELLEELLIDYPGTLLLVSHDRAFLDNVVTGTLVFEGGGRVMDYVGGYTDWQRQAAARKVDNAIQAAAPLKNAASREGQPKAKSSTPKLSYKDQRELEALPGRIEALESEQASLEATICDSGFYQQTKNQVDDTFERLATVRQELEVAFERWEALDYKD